jgi:hypothetical protein
VERDVLAAVAALLEAHGVAWVVMGAVAANRYRREVRLTGDLDLLVASHGSNGLDALEAAFESAGWLVRRGSLDGALLRLRHATLGAVDLVLAETEYQRAAIERAVSDVSGGGVPLRVLRIEDVLVHKLIAGRPRDLADIEDILAGRPELDEAYVERWVEYWDVGELWQQLRAR